jgi:hypothetical protein
MLASISAAAITSVSAAALSGPSADNNLRDASNGRHLPVASAADPVFIAIEQHRQAARVLSAAYQMPDALLEQLQRAEEDALLAWLTAAPIAMAGVIATLEHASRRPYGSDYHTITSTQTWQRARSIPTTSWRPADAS